MFNNLSERFQKALYLVFLCYFGIYIPLFIGDGFFDILQAKFYEIYNARIYIYVLIFISLLLIVYSNRKNIRNIIRISDIVLLSFGILAFISSSLSLHFATSWKGVSGYCVGGFIISLAAMVTIVLSKLKRPKVLFFLPIYIVNVIIIVLAIIEGMGFDPLSTHLFLEDNQRFIYFSTIGNTNWFAGYISIIMMFSFGCYVYVKDKLKEGLFFFLLSISFFCVFVLYADSILLAVVSCAFFAFPYILDSLNRLKKFVNCLMSFGLCLMTAAYTPIIESLKLSHNSGVYGILLDKHYSFLYFLLIVLVFYLVYTADSDMYSKNKKRIIWVIELAMISLTVMIMAVTVSKQGLKWGNDRMGIWAYSMDKYMSFNMKNKLIGVGPENLVTIYSNFSIDYGEFLICAHSEFMQVLLSMGLSGFTAFLALWGTVYYKYFHYRLWKDEYKMIFVLVLTAYFGQSLVNSTTIPNIMLLCFVYGEFVRNS